VGAPRFFTFAEAEKWIKTSSGDLLKGRSIVVFRVFDMMKADVRTETKVTLTRHKKTLRHGPGGEDGD
jgi:hypothetical protein